jgi:hypothetical protein
VRPRVLFVGGGSRGISHTALMSPHVGSSSAISVQCTRGYSCPVNRIGVEVPVGQRADFQPSRQRQRKGHLAGEHAFRSAPESNGLRSRSRLAGRRTRCGFPRGRSGDSTRPWVTRRVSAGRGASVAPDRAVVAVTVAGLEQNVGARQIAILAARACSSPLVAFWDSERSRRACDYMSAGPGCAEGAWG